MSRVCASLRNAKTCTTSNSGDALGNFLRSLMYFFPRSRNPRPSGLALQESAAPAPGSSNGMSSRGITHREMSPTRSFAEKVRRCDAPFGEPGSIAGRVSSASWNSSSSLAGDIGTGLPNAPPGALSALSFGFLPAFARGDPAPPSPSTPSSPRRQQIMPQRACASDAAPDFEPRAGAPAPRRGGDGRLGRRVRRDRLTHEHAREATPRGAALRTRSARPRGGRDREKKSGSYARLGRWRYRLT